MKESYEFMGLDENATDEEIEARYLELKAQYNEDKWKDGEEGNRAARNLNSLEAAYAEIKEERGESKAGAGNGSSLDRVGDAIRSGDLTRAQELLDSFNERNAEWHYLQSVLFYKKNWMSESKKQLEIAMQMDAENAKYREAYENLTRRTEYRTETGGAPNQNPDPASDEKQMGGNWCANCASMCYTFLCVNCLFNLCCNCR